VKEKYNCGLAAGLRTNHRSQFKEEVRFHAGVRAFDINYKQRFPITASPELFDTFADFFLRTLLSL
jgi:hypothetical protein